MTTYERVRLYKPRMHELQARQGKDFEEIRGEGMETPIQVIYPIDTDDERPVNDNEATHTRNNKHYDLRPKPKPDW